MTANIRAAWFMCAASALALPFGCAASLPHATVQDAAWAEQRWSGTSRADLETGRGHYVRACGSCHTLKLPGELPPERWESEVRRMTVTHHIELSDAEQQQIIRYLVTLSSQRREPSQHSAVPGARL